MDLDLPVEFGNAGAIGTEGTGWFIGFSDWCKDGRFDLRHVALTTPIEGLCVKWFFHRAGDPAGQPKPISTGRTVSLLVSERSEFRLDFSASPAFPEDRTLSTTLRAHGDFAIWGGGVYHRAFALSAAGIVTVRWGHDVAR